MVTAGYCRFFQQGGAANCRYGARCRFDHAVDPARLQAAREGGGQRGGPLEEGEQPDQHRAARAAPAAPKPRLPFAFTLTERQTKTLEAMYPGWDFQGQQDLPGHNPHAVLHVERFILTCAAVTRLENRAAWQDGDPPDLLDHWGAPIRLWRAIRATSATEAQARARAKRWWCGIPSLVAADDDRFERYEADPDPPIGACRCQGPVCPHITPTGILDIHGLYYRGPAQLAHDLPEGVVMVSVHHTFDPEAENGDFAGEALWHRGSGGDPDPDGGDVPDSATTITMTVPGATHKAYRHSDLGWMATLPTQFGNVQLASSVVAQGHTQMVSMFRTSFVGWVDKVEGAGPGGLSFRRSMDLNQHGQVDLFQSAKALNTLGEDAGAIRLYAYSGFWDWTSDRARVSVSKALVRQASRFVASQPRSPEVRNVLLDWIERKLRVGGANSTVTAATIHVTALLALLAHVEESMWAMDAWNDMTVFMKVWNSLMAGDTMRWWKWWMVAAAMAATSLAWFLVRWLLEIPTGQGAVVDGGAAHPGQPSNSTLATPPSRGAAFVANTDWAVVWFAVWIGMATLVTVARLCLPRTATYAATLASRSTRRKHVAPTTGAPIAFDDVRAHHFATHEEFQRAHPNPSGLVEKFAVRATVPAPKPVELEAKCDVLRLHAERAVRHPLMPTAGPVFPDIMPVVPSSGPASLAGAAGRLGARYYSDAQLRVVDQNLKALRLYWTPERFAELVDAGAVVWAAGRDASKLTPWFSTHRHAPAWDVDQGRFDSHQRHELKEAVRDVAKSTLAQVPGIAACNPDKAEWAMDMLFQRREAHFMFKTTGKGRDGAFRLNLEHGAITGANETSDFATLTEAMLVVFCLQPEYASLRQMAANHQIVVCGDDTVVAHLQRPRISLEEFERRMNDLGMNAKAAAKPELAQAPFCSSLAWYTHGPHGAVNVLGPLPFRQLSKLGWACNPPLQFTRIEMARAKALSLHKRSNHVPLLGTAVRRVLQLTEAADAKRVASALAYIEAEQARGDALFEDGPYPLVERGVAQFLRRYNFTRAEYDRLDRTLAEAQLDHYYRDDLFSLGIAVDCAVSTTPGAFQDDDLLLRTPFQGTETANPMEPRPWAHRNPAEIQAPALPAAPANCVWDFKRWFDNYTSRGRGAGTVELGTARARASLILKAHQEIMANDYRGLDEAVRKTDAFVKIELLCKTIDSDVEHFAPRAVEAVRPHAVAATGPYVKTMHTYFMHLFPAPTWAQAHPEVALPMSREVAPRRRPTRPCRPLALRTGGCVLLLTLVALAIYFLATMATATSVGPAPKCHVHYQVPPPSAPHAPTHSPMPKKHTPQIKKRNAKPAARRPKRASKAGPAPRGRARARPVAGAAMVAPAAVAASYRQHFTMAHVAGGTHVSLCEPVSRLTTFGPVATNPSASTTQVVRLPFSFAPFVSLKKGNLQLPRLQALANVYARYRVLGVRLRYRPLAESAQRGQVAVAILPAGSQVYGDPAAVGAFDYGASGACWTEIATKWWKPRDQVWLDTAKSVDGVGFQNSLFEVMWMVESQAANDSPGEIWLDMNLMLVDTRPEVPGYFNFAADGYTFTTTAEGGFNFDTAILQPSAVYGSSGYWDFQPMGPGRFYQNTDGTLTALPGQAALLMQAGTFLLAGKVSSSYTSVLGNEHRIAVWFQPFSADQAATAIMTTSHTLTNSYPNACVYGEFTLPEAGFIFIRFWPVAPAGSTTIIASGARLNLSRVDFPGQNRITAAVGVPSVGATRGPTRPSIRALADAMYDEIRDRLRADASRADEGDDDSDGCGHSMTAEPEERKSHPPPPPGNSSGQVEKRQSAPPGTIRAAARRAELGDIEDCVVLSPGPRRAASASARV